MQITKYIDGGGVINILTQESNDSVESKFSGSEYSQSLARAASEPTVVVLRWSDQDINGHVNNARLVTITEEARIAWRARLVDQVPELKLGATVVASLHIDYRKPVVYGGSQLSIRVFVKHVGGKSYTLGYRAIQADELVFDASTTLVQINRETHATEQLSTWQKQIFELIARSDSQQLGHVYSGKVHS